MPEDLTENLLQWVEGSGRALELRVARAFASEGGARYVRQSISFQDPNMSSTTREGDVLAGYHWIANGLSITVEATIECKSGKSHPWVAFFDDVWVRPERPDELGTIGGEWPDDDLNALAAAISHSGVLRTVEMPTHALSAMGKDSVNSVMDAARQALSFASSRSNIAASFADDPKGSVPVTVSIPIVITEAPLFTCRLSESGYIELEEVERFDVWVETSPYSRVRVLVTTETRGRELAAEFARLKVDMPTFRDQ